MNRYDITRIGAVSSSLILLLFLCFSCGVKNTANSTSNIAPDHDLSVMSFNIRYNTDADGEHRWDKRKEACISMLNSLKPSVFGIQEGLSDQVKFIDKELPGYNYVGIGRDDGVSAGEYSAIYYMKDKFKVLDSGSFWLSETTDKPGVGWDANNIRIATWAKLKDISLDKIVFVLNTHFDHMGKIAQEESSKLIAEKVKELSDNQSIFVMGDFNLEKDDPKLSPISLKYNNAKDFSNASDRHNSYNGWGKASVNIDFIFYKNVKIIAFRTVVEDYGVPYISDHYPVYAHFNY